MQLDDVALRVLHDARAGDVIGVAQPHFAPRRQPEKLLRRVFAEIIAFDVEDFRERDAALAHRFIFRIVNRLNLFHRIVGKIVNHDFERIQDRHHARRGAVQFLADAEL